MEQNSKKTRTNSMRIGITQGDFNGVSYELVINSLVDETICELFTPVFFGCSKLVSYFRKLLKVENFSFVQSKINELAFSKPNLINIYDKEAKVNIGAQTEEAAELAILSLNAAYEAIRNRNIDAIVCSPISLGLLKDKAPDFRNNGSFFANLVHSENAMRIFCKDNLRIATLSNYQIGEIENSLSVNYLHNKILQLDRSLKREFVISSPRIAVLAVNPINEYGNFPSKIESMIESAVYNATLDNVFVCGPYSSSQLFNETFYKSFDAILTICEEQAATIFTLLNGKDGAIYTTGLPFTVTEPFCDAHSDQIGKDVISTQTMRYAMYLAKDITSNRIENYHLRKNVLKISKLELAKNEPG